MLTHVEMAFDGREGEESGAVGLGRQTSAHAPHQPWMCAKRGPPLLASAVP